MVVKSLSLFLSLLVCLLICLVSSFKECTKVDQCRFKTDEGEINLEPLARTDGEPRFANIKDVKVAKTNYYYNPCKPWTAEPESFLFNNCQKIAACLQIETTSYINIGTQDSAQIIHNATKETCILKLTGIFGGGYVPQKSYTYITIKCDEDEEGRLDPFVSDNANLIFRTTLHTKYACFPGLSVGSVLVITFFTLLVVYLITGILLNKFTKGASGKEVLPNYDFWCDVPSLIKDGIAFCYQSCKRLTSREGYTKI